MYKKKYKSQRIRGKLRVCRYLSSNKKLKGNVPHTVSFTKANLKTMSDQYKSLYIKPDVGCMGIGVYKINRVGDGFELYSTHKRKQVRKPFETISALYQHLKARQSQKMIIQKTISLDQVDGRPYDIRSMVQRKPGGPWVCTGFMAKVGAPKKIVTNYSQGGKIYTLRNVLQKKGLSSSQSRLRIRLLSKKTLEIARTLSRKHTGMHEMGIDFAYDTKQRLRILEVNSNHPQFHPLKKLDPTAYNRMLSFAKSYGRKNAK